MYNLDEIKEFISVLENSSLSVLEVQKEDGSKIHIEKPVASQQIAVPAPAVVQAAAPAAAPEAVSPAVSETAPADNGKTVNAPIVGVFYAASAPGAEPYVSVGKQVKKGDTVCIIEAMKCMNEISAEENCEIVEVLVKDGELVEFGQPLFKVR